jgi:hypothetical protein
MINILTKLKDFVYDSKIKRMFLKQNPPFGRA